MSSPAWWVPYVCLSLAIVALWIPRPWRTADGRTHPAVWGALLLLAIALGLVTAIVRPIALLAIVLFGTHGYGLSDDTLSPRVRHVNRLLVVLYALALMAHVVPGFSNVLVVKDAAISPDAVPFTLYLNFDKPLIGLFILGFALPLIRTPRQWASLAADMLPRVPIVIAVVIVCALAMGQVRVDPKVPDVFPFWVWSNLLFTCTAEEALFRGVIQRALAPPAAPRRRAWLGIVAAGALFGIAHYAGGPKTVALATIAGTGYGWMYWRTGRIEAAILTHFLLNTVHILLFTYPALRP